MVDQDNSIDALFVASFNADLAELGCAASIVTAGDAHNRDVFELLDEDRQFLAYLPLEASPRVTAAAYRLYGQALDKGLRAGEALAWSKLRQLIGAAPSEPAG
jgi:hypothetical protein